MALCCFFPEQGGFVCLNGVTAPDWPFSRAVRR
jgi:hypothetical protein